LFISTARLRGDVKAVKKNYERPQYITFKAELTEWSPKLYYVFNVFTFSKYKIRDLTFFQLLHTYSQTFSI